MISFDLRCRHHHVFEAWFRSSADYDGQLACGLIACPVCQDTALEKALMAPNVSAKANRRQRPRAPAMPNSTAPTIENQMGKSLPMAAGAMPALPPEAAAILAEIAEIQAKSLPQSRWVGRRFAEEARALHSTHEDSTDLMPLPAIHGEATADEAQELLDEGIAIMPLLVPIVPPDQKN